VNKQALLQSPNKIETAKLTKNKKSPPIFFLRNIEFGELIIMQKNGGANVNG
jgi:hypothetical protein